MSEPFNAAAHNFFISNGYTCKRIAADYDDGTPESGPGYGGHPEFDLYEDGIEDVVILVSGEADRNIVDQEFEVWMREHSSSR